MDNLRVMKQVTFVQGEKFDDYIFKFLPKVFVTITRGSNMIEGN